MKKYWAMQKITQCKRMFLQLKNLKSKRRRQRQLNRQKRKNRLIPKI